MLSAPLRDTARRQFSATATANDVVARDASKHRAGIAPSNVTRFHPTTATASVPSTINVTNDAGVAADDYEPSIISILKNGTFSTMHTVMVEHRYYADPPQPAPPAAAVYRPQLVSFHTTATPPTGASSFSGPTRLPLYSGYSTEGDPYLAENPYSTGVSPGRIYCTGLLWNDDYLNNPSAVGVWYSDDGGASWSGPSIVTSISGGGHVLDKPMITVSYYSGTRGYIYVSYVNVDGSDSTNNTLNVRKSTDGGANWSDERVPAATGYVHFPTVVANPFSSTVYLIWRAFGTGGTGGTINMLSSANWSATPETVASSGLLNKDATLRGRVVVNTIPMARYNAGANELAVVYTALDANNFAHVYYTHRPSGAWSSPTLVTDNTVQVQNTDQFMPALDYTSAGNVIVAYYDRRDDYNSVPAYGNTYYREYYTYLTSSGGHVNSQSDFAASPSGMNPDSNNMSSQGHGLGDYQDIWDDNYYLETERASSAWIGSTGYRGADLYFSRVTY